MTKQEREEQKRARFAALTAFDRGYREQGFRMIAGVDEVGRGPLAGPVVTAAVVLPEDFDAPGIDDSKKLTDRQRRVLNDRILREALAVGFGERPSERIDEINILNATKEAMRDAVRAADRVLRERTGEGISIVLVDAVDIPGLGCPQRAVVKGDASSAAIACASIVAKVRRDDFMIRMDDVYPGYGFARNKGYGTRAHYDGIAAQGVSPIHRRSFLRNLDEHIGR